MKITDIGLLIIRLALGTIFVAHGSQKLFGALGGSGMSGFIGMVGKLGFPLPVFWAYAAAISEFGGGLFLILGVIPRTSAALIAITMLVAISKIHLANGFFAKDGGIEYQLLILSVCLGLILTGSGGLSLFNKF